MSCTMLWHAERPVFYIGSKFIEKYLIGDSNVQKTGGVLEFNERKDRGLSTQMFVMNKKEQLWFTHSYKGKEYHASWAHDSEKEG